MSEIKITTLTPIHIGSGVMLSDNIDFVREDIKDEDNKLQPYIGVIDEQRILDIIGEDKINLWVANIEKKGNIKEFIQKYAYEKVTIQNYSKRFIYCPFTIRDNSTLKECIHDGFGKAYIPGSSIKGAIRTAILAQNTGKIKNWQSKIDTKRLDKKGNPILNAKEVEKEFFGQDPKADFMRFLHIGDAYFGECCEDAINMVNLNIRERNDYLDKSKSQIVEVITAGEESTFNLKIDLSQNKLPFTSAKELFALINNHTKKLLKEELDIWKDYVKEDIVNYYIDAISYISQEVENCDENSCILRVGHASGWRFITGAWSEDADKDTWDKICKASRPNDAQKYSKYIFPKSRRINVDEDNNMTLLGFVKLELNKTTL